MINIFLSVAVILLSIGAILQFIVNRIQLKLIHSLDSRIKILEDQLWKDLGVRR